MGVTTACWHRIEYYRIDRGRRVLDRVEVVDDLWPYLYQSRDVSREDSVRIYARAVGEDYLDRRSHPAGRWVVVLWRLAGERDPAGTRLCEVELRWNGSAVTQCESRTAVT